MKKFVAFTCVIVILAGAELAQDERTAGFRLSRGKIESQDGSAMKVKDSTSSTSQTYQTTDGTQVNIEGKKLSDLKSGDEITIVYSRQGDKNTIREISDNQYVQGKIQSRSDDQITVKSGEKTLAMKVNDKTRISINDRSSRPSDLREGDECACVYTGSGDNLTARYIEGRRSK